MNLKIRHIFLLPLIILLFACEKETKTATYPFASLYMLTVDNDISVRLIQDSANFIEIIGPEKVVDKFVPQINGDTILLSNKHSSSKYFDELWAEVHIKNLRVLFLRSGGSVVNLDTLRFSSFVISSNGAMGDVKLNLNCEQLSLGISTGALSINLSGKAARASIWTTAPGSIDLRAFEADQVTCRNNSSNDCYVWATKKLNAEVQYTGRIFYRGTPALLLIPEGQEEFILPLNE